VIIFCWFGFINNCANAQNLLGRERFYIDQRSYKK
jgi:hypothetical protein